MIKILIVEDEKPISELIRMNLDEAGYQCECVYDGLAAADRLENSRYDLVLLDVMLPGADGFELMEYIRPSGIPVIFLTARTEVRDRVRGLRAGADDYLTKPFSVEELLARLRVTFRRISMLQNAAGCSVFTNGDLQIDFAAGCATLKGQELHLTPIEYRLLCVMAKNCGKVLTHTYITHEVWGSSWDNDVASLRVFMATLRKKLESEPDSPQYIQTHIGIGYRMLKV